MCLNLLDSWHRGDHVVQQVIPQLLGIESRKPGSFDQVGALFGKAQKVALVVLAQFQIEGLFHNVARELGLPQHRGFFRAMKGVVEHTGLTSHDVQILNTPARIRNSLHANGIHHAAHSNEPEAVLVAGIEYVFKDGEVVRCASWEHIAHALEASIGVVRAVLTSERVQAIPDPMFEGYAWDVETAPGGAV
jgi:hypothetical protein